MHKFQSIKYRVRSKYFLLLTSYLLLQNSCSGPSPLRPLSGDVDGPLHGYYAVADSVCMPTDDSVTVHLVRLKKGLPSPWKKQYRLGYADKTYEMAFSFELTDTTGGIGGYVQTDLFRDREQLTALANLPVGDTATIAFPLPSSSATAFRVGSVFNVNLAADRPASASSVSNPPVADLDNIALPNIRSMEEEINKEVRAREEAERRAAEERAREEEERRRAEEAEQYDTPWDVIRESSRDIYHEATRKMREWLGFGE